MDDKKRATCIERLESARIIMEAVFDELDAAEMFTLADRSLDIAGYIEEIKEKIA